MPFRHLSKVGAVAACAAVLTISACSSGTDSSASPSSTTSDSVSGSGSAGALATDAAVEDIASQFQCDITKSTSQSSGSAESSGSADDDGGLGVPSTNVLCSRKAFDFTISAFEDDAGKQKALGLLSFFTTLSQSQFSYCDGGLWIVVTDVDIKDNPTPEQVQKLQRGAEVAHDQLGCEVVTVAGNTASNTGDGTITASVEPSNSAS